MDDSLDDAGEGEPLAPEALVGLFESALVEALILAAKAKRWERVTQLAEELARRQDQRNSGQHSGAAGMAASRAAR
jgi:hypothetical protein